MKFTNNSQLSLWKILATYLEWAQNVDIAVAFLRMSGIRIVVNYFRNIITNGGRIRVICGKDFGYTEPDALQELRKIGVKVKVFTGEQIFHPKAFIFWKDDQLRGILGSSNLTASGLESGVEWNIAIDDDQEILHEMGDCFESLWKSAEVKELTDTLLSTMRQDRTEFDRNPVHERIEKLLDFSGDTFSFPFRVGPAFLDPRYPHPLTIPKKYYPVLGKYLTKDHTDVGVFEV